MRKTMMFLLCILFAFLNSCAFIYIPLDRTTRPLLEEKIEGRGRNKILIVNISGVITNTQERSLLSDKNAPSVVARVKEELDKAAKDKHIKAVILKINSPGGTVTASDIIYQEIKKFKQKKKVPVVACLMDVATSGAYYVANASDTIIAHPTTITGSIGVIVMKLNLKGLMDKLGVEDESIASGDKKDILSPFRSMTEEENKIMQEIITSMYEKFLAAVDSGRKELSLDTLRPLADGRIFTADQALLHKMIDSIGYLDAAIFEAKKMAGITDARVVTYRRSGEYKNNIYSQATINLFSLGDNSSFEKLPVQFMYLWKL
jgi:protease-4